MKSALLLPLLVLPALAHPNHPPSVHGEDLDLQKAHEEVSATNQVSIRIEGDLRVIESNGIPDHETGEFPGRGNPHAIREQSYSLSIPLKPEVAEEPTELVRQPFGVALNGVLFDPGTAEYYRNDRDSDWNYEAISGEINLGLDEHHAHVQPNGAYHYHGLPTGLLEKLAGKEKGMVQIGWAADGFPIYGLYGYKDPKDPGSEVVELKSSYQLKEGQREGGAGTPRGEYDGTFTLDYEYKEGTGDLDECNGREGVTPEFPDGTYYYVLTADYPFIPRMFRGTPDESFERKGPGPGGRPGGTGGERPHPPMGPRPGGPRGPGGPPRR